MILFFSFVEKLAVFSIDGMIFCKRFYVFLSIVSTSTGDSDLEEGQIKDPITGEIFHESKCEDPGMDASATHLLLMNEKGEAQIFFPELA